MVNTNRRDEVIKLRESGLTYKEIGRRLLPAISTARVGQILKWKPKSKRRRMRMMHPLFVKYQRNWLHEVTGFSKGYLCRVATGRAVLTRSFIERVCFKLNQPEAELFLPDAEAHSSPSQSRRQQ